MDFICHLDFNSSSLKREGCVKWDEYFMGIALLAAQRSKDPKTQVGACIVGNPIPKILGVGYNGMPMGCRDNTMSWAKKDGPNNKHLYVCHAEMNAILFRNCADISGSTIYVTHHPCNECAKCIIQSGIKNVVYLWDFKNSPAAKKMFENAGIKVEKYNSAIESIFLSFKEGIKSYKK